MADVAKLLACSVYPFPDCHNEKAQTATQCNELLNRNSKIVLCKTQTAILDLMIRQVQMKSGRPKPEKVLGRLDNQKTQTAIHSRSVSSVVSTRLITGAAQVRVLHELKDCVL